MQQQSYHLATDVQQLRSRLHDVEKHRERERSMLAQNQQMVAQLQVRIPRAHHSPLAARHSPLNHVST